RQRCCFGAARRHRAGPHRGAGSLSPSGIRRRPQRIRWRRVRCRCCPTPARRSVASLARSVALLTCILERKPGKHSPSPGDFATHAVADTRDPDRSRILLAPSDSGAQPDYLFLREIYDLDLRGVTLVTLSACDTERGKIVRGEGVEGFSRALLAAGASAAVT